MSVMNKSWVPRDRNPFFKHVVYSPVDAGDVLEYILVCSTIVVALTDL